MNLNNIIMIFTGSSQKSAIPNKLSFPLIDGCDKNVRHFVWPHHLTLDVPKYLKEEKKDIKQ